MDTTPIELMCSLAGLSLACGAVGVTIFPPDHLTGKYSRFVRIVLGWILVIAGFGGFISIVLIIASGKSKETTHVWFFKDTNSKSALYKPKPSIKKPTIPPDTNCQAVSIWFLNTEPEFNVFPEDKEGDIPKPKLEMKFYVSVINETKQERYVTFVPNINAFLPNGWEVKQMSIEPLSGAETVLNNNNNIKILIGPEKHFLSNMRVTIVTEDMRTTNFYKSFNSLNENVDFLLTVKTDEGETCLASQTFAIKKGFLTNFNSNHEDITKMWGK
jgi:hypothetical protein